LKPSVAAALLSHPQAACLLHVYNLPFRVALTATSPHPRRSAPLPIMSRKIDESSIHAAISAASSSMNWSRDVQELTVEVYQALEEVSVQSNAMTSTSASLQERLTRLAQSPPPLPDRAIPALLAKATGGPRSVEALLSVYPEFQDATVLVAAEKRHRAAVAKLHRLLRQLFARSLQDLIAVNDGPDDDSGSGGSSLRLPSASSAAPPPPASHFATQSSPASNPHGASNGANSDTAPSTPSASLSAGLSSSSPPASGASSSLQSTTSAFVAAVPRPSTIATTIALQALSTPAAAAAAVKPERASLSPASSPSSTGSTTSTDGLAASNSSVHAAAAASSSRPARSSETSRLADGRGANSPPPLLQRERDQRPAPRTSAASANKFHLPSWCTLPLVEDPLAIVPAGGLGLTPPAVYAEMCGLGKAHLALRVWSDRGPDALLAAIIRSEDFDAVSKHQHPTEEDIGLLRANLQTLVETCSDEEFDSWFPDSMIHLSRDEVIAVLDEPHQHLEADLLYVYHAWASGPDSSIRIHLITVGEGLPTLRIIGDDDGSLSTDCTTIYENASVQPAHYEAVCFKKPNGNSRHRTMWPSSDVTMRSLQAWARGGSFSKKRSAVDSPMFASQHALKKRDMAGEAVHAEFGEETEEDEGVGHRGRESESSASL
jgi:hypothetical protein